MKLFRIQRGAIIAGVVAALLLVFGFARLADANPKVKKQIERMNQQAMENFDLLEYEEARKLLNEAIILAKKNRLDDDPIVARSYLNLGIVNFSGFGDAEAARLNFIDAVRADPSVQIDAAYKTGEMVALLEDARGQFAGGGRGGGGGGGGGGAPSVDCGSVEGMAHTLVDTAPAGAKKSIEAHVSGELGADRVSLHYRPQGAADFSEVKMTRAGDCTYRGEIPAAAIKGEFLHYYVAAYNQGGKVIASRGSSGSPNIIEVAGAAGVDSGIDENPLDSEDPLGGGSRGGGSVRSGATVGSSGNKLFVSIAVGSGGGYVTGSTEQVGNEVGCCFAPALLHLFPEVGYYLSAKSSISAAFRMGFPIGANIPGHATAAPSVLLRYRQSLGADFTGLQFNAGIGGGVIRHTVKLSDRAGAMDTDTVASGPLLLGAGIGWVKALGGPIRFVAETNALAGIPVIDELGTCPEDGGTAQGCVRTHFAVQFDVNLGLMFAF